MTQPELGYWEINAKEYEQNITEKKKTSPKGTHQ